MKRTSYSAAMGQIPRSSERTLLVKLKRRCELTALILNGSLHIATSSILITWGMVVKNPGYTSLVFTARCTYMRKFFVRPSVPQYR